MKKLAIMIIASLSVAGMGTVFAQNYVPIVDYVYNHYGLPVCQDPDYFFNDYCKRQNIIIQQNDELLGNMSKLEQQNTQIIQNQHYQLCITALAPASGSLPANYLALHGIDCSLPHTSQTPGN